MDVYGGKCEVTYFVLTILISTNSLSTEKASRGGLLEAFDAKILVCFKVDGNKIKAVNHER
jgi:hypothetical protein